MADDCGPLTSLEILDPERLVEAILNAELRPSQLSGCPAPSMIARLMGSRVCLDLVSLGPAMLFSGAMPKDCYSLSFVLTCPGLGNSFNFGATHTDGYMGFFPPGAPLDAMTPEGCHTATLTVPVAEFHAAAARLFPGIPDRVLRRGAGMRVGAAEQLELRGLLAVVAEGIRKRHEHFDNPSVRVQIERDLLAVFFAALRSGCNSLVPPPRKRAAGRYQRMRQARDFIADHFQKGIHLDDLSSEIGLSMRGTENLFKDLMGVNPIVFLRHHRLHGVRRTLLQSSQECGVVKRAAMEMGFFHMGRFASEYRAFFSENPHVTLSRSGCQS